MGVAEPGEAAFDGSSACTLDSITVLSYLSATWRPTLSALEHTLAEGVGRQSRVGKLHVLT